MRDIDFENAITEIETITAGMLISPSVDKKQYRVRDAYRLSKKLGRPLTDEELSAFEISPVTIKKIYELPNCFLIIFNTDEARIYQKSKAVNKNRFWSPEILYRKGIPVKETKIN